MSTVIVVANQKGGVGKTTTVVNKAHFYHGKGKKVLVVDFDGQGNASSTIGEEHDLGIQAQQLFDEKPINIPMPESGLGLISADFSLNDVEELPINAIAIPRQHLKSIEWADIIIIDTPPSLGRRLLGAVIASDFLICPMDLSRFSSDGLDQLMETIGMVKENFNPDLEFLGILVNKVNTRSTAQKKTLENLYASLGDMVIPQMVANRAAIGDSIDGGEPVSAIKTGAGRKGAEEFKKVFEFIEAKIKAFNSEKGLSND